MKAYKGFGPDLKCRDFQYEEGKTYTEDKADLCHCGFHACENPLDIFHYYQISGGAKYREVECNGEITEQKDDSKFACTDITVGAEIKLADIIKIGMKSIWERIKRNPEGVVTGAASGDYSTGAASGYYSTGAASGDCSTGAASGNCSTGAASGNYSTGAASGDCSTGAASGYHSTGAASGRYSTGAASGKDSIAVANGYKARVKGEIGNYLVTTEYSDDMALLHCKMVQVDGTKIKANTLYMLKDGEFVEAHDETT